MEDIHEWARKNAKRVQVIGLREAQARRAAVATVADTGPRTQAIPAIGLKEIATMGFLVGAGYLAGRWWVKQRRQLKSVPMMRELPSWAY